LRFHLNKIVLKYKKEKISFFYQELAKLDFVTLGYDTINDITCPGTDTCNLGIAGSWNCRRIRKSIKIRIPAIQRE
jgi:sulfite reductase (ferredoxin)